VRQHDHDDERGGGGHSELSGSARDVVQASSVSGGIHFHQENAGYSRDKSRPRQLPSATRVFVDRATEMRHLDALLNDTPTTPVVSVCVIAGTAGAGKTSLALEWAHRVREHFPDGQLYVNLRGYDPGIPMVPQEALARFLLSLGVPVNAIPADVDAAAALYRSTLADRRILILLDNAASVAQVRPLLPGDSHCLVIVTSRSRLSGLAVREGASRLTLGRLPEPDAVTLVRMMTANHRHDDDTEKILELSRLCARLPLALRIAAERAASHPHMSLEELIADLRDESSLWDALSTGDDAETEAVHSVFAWSYRALPPHASRLFRLLGIHPGPDFSLGAAAALAGMNARRARQQLDVLVGAHMLEQTAPDRFEFHDLLRAYALDQALSEEKADERSSALGRVVDWYLRTADAAQSWIKPAEDHVPLEPPNELVTPLAFANYDEAVDWSESEHANFLPLVRAAHTAGLMRHTWQLAVVLWNAQAPSAVITDWLAMGQIGLAAAQAVHDPGVEATIAERLGFGHARINELTVSLTCHTQALRIRQELADLDGEAASLNALGITHLRRRELSEAENYLERSRRIFADLRATHWEAICRANLALARYEAGNLFEAAHDIRLALDVHRAEGNKADTGNALWILGSIQLGQGHPDQALRTAHEAVDIALELRDHVAEGCWLLGLADAHQACGHLDEALTAYHRSATLHRRLGDRTREALAWHGTGTVYQQLGRDNEAADFHQRAAAVHHELGDAWHEAIALDSLATAVLRNEPEEARRYWALALDLLTGYDDARAAACRDRIDSRLRSPHGDE
jgi:tetratricopeptide (TPR) repeat protein